MAREAKYELAYFDYKSDMPYKDIAQKYGVSVDTVKSWKTRHWNRMDRGKGTSKSVQKKVCTPKRTQASVHTSPEDAVDQVAPVLEPVAGTTDKEQIFCLLYVQEFNATQAYLKAFNCTYETAKREAWKLKSKPGVAAEIERLKQIKAASLFLDGVDVVELHMRIAFANMHNYAVIKDNDLSFQNSDETDGQLINEVAQTRDGLRVKLADRQRSLRFLETYFTLNPMDRHCKEYDARKLELELLKVQAALPDVDGDSGSPTSNFAEAMETSAAEIWADENGKDPTGEPTE